jgi:carbonic anhydrase/acetyltransferase-like protein (isoleucine patch superfamily)
MEEQRGISSNLPERVTIVAHGGIVPTIPDSVLIAPGARIIGDVVMGERSSVWYNVVIRGDVHYIRIGEETNIQDGSVLHVTHDTHPLVIGNRVTVGHGVRLHGCTVEDETLIGIGAIVLDGAVVEERSMVAAGALVPPGMRVPSGKLVAGVPARVRRDLNADELANFKESADRYVEYARVARGEGHTQFPHR